MSLGEDCSNVSTLRDRLSHLRGKPIHLVPMAIPDAALNGMWMSTSQADLVIYEARTTRAHQDHIIAHELSHILCGHQALGGVDGFALASLFPDIAPEVVRRVLQRTEYSDLIEQEAEMTASLLLAPSKRRRRTAAPPPAQSDDVVTRLRAAVAGPLPSRPGQ
jgi:hypothetical protein